MPDAALPPAKTRPCIEAVKVVYAISDTLYDVDVKNTELNDEQRATILNLLTEIRNRAFECGCDKIAEDVDALRIKVVLNKQLKVVDIRDEVDKFKETAKACLKPPAAPA